MNDRELGIEAYKLMMAVRKKYSLHSLVLFIIMCIIGYIAINDLFANTWWFIPLVGILGALLSIFMGAIISRFESYAVVHCPKCSGMIEKNKTIADVMPKICQHCGLNIRKI